MRREDNAGSSHPFIFVPSSLRFVPSPSSANNALARPPSCSSSPVYTTLLSQPSYFTLVLAARAIVHRVENRRTSTLSFANSFAKGVSSNISWSPLMRGERQTYFSLMIFYFFLLFYYFRQMIISVSLVAILKRKEWREDCWNWIILHNRELFSILIFFEESFWSVLFEIILKKDFRIIKLLFRYLIYVFKWSIN